ncbi:MAG TPA: hypothetical protein VE442_03545 [Jatrophihabitans sp.]|nr:hypothetical protein [Jatrophihabitans sp.]
MLFHIRDGRIGEASGIAPGLASPGVFYVENDSGDTHRFFALNRRTGATAAVITVSNARNVDWEDIAVARDAAGTPSVWLADIGDNDAKRNEVEVYRVREPHIRPTSRQRSIHVRATAVWRLRYPSGPVNAESLAVAPGGTAYIATKTAGAAVVYRLPARPAAGRAQLLRRVGRVPLLTGTANPLALLGATSAAFARNGAVFVLRTYVDAYVWRVGPSGLSAALHHAPKRVALPRQRQGEGIALVGRRLVIDSEGRRTPVYAVPFALPATHHNTPSPRPTRTATPTPHHKGGGGPASWLAVIALVGLGILGLLVLALRHAYRSH